MVSIGNVSDHGIYTDLFREFRDRGHDVYVVCPMERGSGTATELCVQDGVSVLRVRTGNLQKVGILEKVWSTLRLEEQFVSAIARFLGDVVFDLVVCSTPPVTFDRVVRYLKRRDQCATYLLLKDIFPQNAVDLGIIRRGGLLWRYFRHRERRLYAVSDHIGCMSKANVTYLLAENRQIAPDRVEECPNSIRPQPMHKHEVGASWVRDAYGIPVDALLIVFGGNLGKPQGLSFLLCVLDACKGRRDVFFLVVGSGTEYPRIESHLRKGGHPNAALVSSLPIDQYDRLLEECDLGLILLDPRFTIPNFPSRLTAYMEASLPILAATDASTDIRDVLEDSGCGFWVQNGDLLGFVSCIDHLVEDAVLRHHMGARGREYLEEHYTVARSYATIVAHGEGK